MSLGPDTHSSADERPAERAALLTLRGLKKHFPVRGGFLSRRQAAVRAVDGVDLEIASGETVGVVGESGSGKTTLGRCILRLIEPTSGEIRFDGVDVLHGGPRELRDMRRNMQIVFQDPFSSLNPRKTVAAILMEAFRVHDLHTPEERWRKAGELAARVGLRPEHLERLPHEFSGGQRQRIAIARAIALNPKFIVADEPVSALDVSIRAQILNLMVELQREFGLTYLFISHDLSVVRHICDRVCVMYLGRIVEIGPPATLYRAPLHPYTAALLAAVPTTARRKADRRATLAGDIPSPSAPPPGCAFHPRCPRAQALCRIEAPLLLDRGDARHAACHFPLEQAPDPTPVLNG